MDGTTTRAGVALRFALAGAAFGVLDGVAARWAAPGWGWGIPIVGALLDGTVLGLLGLAIDRVQRRDRAKFAPGARRRWIAVLAAAGVTGLTQDGSSRGQAPPPDVTPVGHGAARDVLWVAVDGLRAEDLAAGHLPRLAEWSTEATLFRQSWASSDDPDLALQAQRTGRVALDDSGPVPEDDNGAVLGLLTTLGLETHAIVGGPVHAARGATSIDIVVPWRDGFPAGAHRLLLGRLVGAVEHLTTGRVAPRAADPATVAQRAAQALPKADDPARIVFVHVAAPTLPALDPDAYDLEAVHLAWMAEVDEALGYLLDEAEASDRAATLRILVTGTAGVQTTATPVDGAPSLRPDTTHVVTLFRRPGEPTTGGTVDAYVRSEDIGPGVIGEAIDARLDEAFDGRSPFRRLAEVRGGKRLDLSAFDLVPPPDAGGRPWALPPARPNEVRREATDPVAWRPTLCDLLHDRTDDEVAVSRRRDGAIAIRQGGYALRTSGDLEDVAGDFLLHNDWVDVREHDRGLAAASSTCGDVPATERAVSMATAARAQAEAARARRGTPWPEALLVPVRQRPPGAPDPREILARHGITLP
jgi:hypothetical protein